MLFTSLEFLCMFLPVTLAGYFLLDSKFRNYWLLACSLFFYAWGEPSFVIFMVASIVFNYVMAILISLVRKKDSLKWLCKLFLFVTVAGNLSVLFVYKYMNFVTATLLSMFPNLQGHIPQTSFLLPIGISFFTFQAMSYVIDVYRGVPVQKNPFYIGLYVSFFPQLIAGPIVRYTTVEEQIKHREITFDSFSQGVKRFVIGFNKKMLLANVMGEVADKVWAQSEFSVLTAWIGIICYTLQIFYDFSGYSDMAIGLGKIFGFDFLENFDYPYCSRSVTEFWRRWHISLGTWFRDYVYFPLGGSRVESKVRLIFNLFVVWLLTGIWHGANWTFILWGVLYGVLITVEKLLNLPKRIETNLQTKILGHICTMLAVMLGWVLFRSDNIGIAGSYIATMFGWNGRPLIDEFGLFHLKDYSIIILAGVVCGTPAFKLLGKKVEAIPVLGDIMLTAGNLFQLLLMLVSISALVMNAHNPFIYFNF